MPKDNEPLSSLTHLIGASLALIALALMIVFAAIRGTVTHIVSYSIFGTAMLLLYIMSTIYHFLPKGRTSKKVFQKLDHSMIYVLIAGTYTPIALVGLKGVWGWTIFGIIWGLATLGISLKCSFRKVNQIFSTLLYLVMGWLIVIAYIPLIKTLPTAGVRWLFSGGLFYTFGVIFFALDHKIKRTRWWGLHELFHLFVIAGSFCHFWLMLKHIILI